MALPKLFDVQVAQQQFDRIVIGWLHAPGLGVPDPALRVDIYRSYAEEGGYELIGSATPEARIYVDEAHQVQRRWLKAFYKLVVSDSANSEEYGPVYLTDGEDRIARMIRRRMNLMLKNMGASPVLIYQQVFNEDRCPDCWDAALQQVMFSNCPTCGGTGFAGPRQGYYDPLLTILDIRPPAIVQTVEDTASSPMQTTARMANFPELRPNDIIREVNRGTLWRVVAVEPQRKDHALITQDPISLVAIKPGDIEYQLTIPDSLTPLLTRRRVATEKILQDNDSDSTRFLEVII